MALQQKDLMGAMMKLGDAGKAFRESPSDATLDGVLATVRGNLASFLPKKKATKKTAAKRKAA